MTKTNCEHCWISLILRIAVASLFVAAAVPKWVNGLAGLQGIVDYFAATFKDSWLPGPLVAAHARVVPFIEALIPVWLILGYRLRMAWAVTALFLVTLAFGMLVTREHAVAANNFLYVMIACWGLYFSQYDCLSIDGLLRKEPC